MKVENSLSLSFEHHLKPSQPVEQTATSFADFLTDTVNTTNHQLLAADDALHQLAMGESQNLHQSMITMEEAKLSFQFLEQIRNRLMTAYQDILREQI